MKDLAAILDVTLKKYIFQKSRIQYKVNFLSGV